MTAPAPAPARAPLSPPPPAPSFIRPVLGFLAGLGVTVLIIGPGVIIATLAALRGVDARQFVATPGYIAAAMTIHLVGSVAGGWTTARLTVGRSFYSVLLLTTVLVTALVSQAMKGAPKAGEPSWYPYALAAVVALGTLAGGLLQRRGSAGHARTVA